MKWKTDDLKKYVQAKEYIDTVIIPLQPFHFSEESSLEKDAFLRESLAVFSNDIEKELSGRVMLTPTYNYAKFSNIEDEVARLNDWIKEIEKQPFSTVFILTFETAWKKNESAINGNLLWLPGISSGDINSKETITVIRNQVEQISELIRSYW